MNWSQSESLFNEIDKRILRKRFEQRDELIECFELLKKTIKSSKWDIAKQERLFQIWVYNKRGKCLKLNSKQEVELFVMLYKAGWLKYTRSCGKEKERDNA